MIRGILVNSANAVRRSPCDPNRILSVVLVRLKSNVQQAEALYDDESETILEIQRLQKIRNVGIFAHIDAGKTTVTERCLALAGVVRRAGCVDDGTTVMDFLPAERERGITISAAAITFPWHGHHTPVNIALIDTPGHVDFSVEVNRSVAVLDGAVLVVDSVAGVQAQTETVWRAMTAQGKSHESLPCLALINKMDKEGCHFGNAIASLRQKLPGANPIPIQIPLFRTGSASSAGSWAAQQGIVAVSVDKPMTKTGGFVGVIDLIYMRAIVWPETSAVDNVEACVPDVINLLGKNGEPIHQGCSVTQIAFESRHELLEALAECDETIEEFYLNEQEPTPHDLRAAVRRVTLSQKGVPVMAAAALRGKGVEPVMDAIADFLPSPLDRQAPGLVGLQANIDNTEAATTRLGHPLHPAVLALAFKVVHMKGRGGSGDGRVVFARVYSGELRDRSNVQVLSPPVVGEAFEKPRRERIGGMLELSGGRFGNLENGVCKSGEVCALIGLKSVVTGDTIMMAPEKAKKRRYEGMVCLSGVAPPRPVLKVRLEAESREQQARLSEALALLAIEDPSLVVEETESATLLSGLGELHMEVTLDRLKRQFGLNVMVGPPTVSYRETITDTLQTDGLLNYDRTIGDTRLEASVSLVLEPYSKEQDCESNCMSLGEPIVTVSDEVKEFLNLDPDVHEEDLAMKCEVFGALVYGALGALKRGPIDSHAMANVKCQILQVDAEGGLPALQALPGAARAAVAHAISTTLAEGREQCRILEPTMGIEITLPGDMVGQVLSDLTGSRRGAVDDVIVGENNASKAMIRGHVPLVEILGYANSLRSLTGGEGAFSAEYKGHSLAD